MCKGSCQLLARTFTHFFFAEHQSPDQQKSYHTTAMADTFLHHRKHQKIMFSSAENMVYDGV